MDQVYKQRVDHFLACKNIAVAGYSRDPKQVANNLYAKFEKNGYKVFGLNPKAEEIKEIPCYPNLKSIPEKPDAVMISTPPEGSMEVIRECIELNIKHAWIHCSIGEGSYHKEAIELAEKNGIEIIPRGCPNMFLKADGFHLCMKWFMNLQGRLKID
jgi:predicted CoA-binding protein